MKVMAHCHLFPGGFGPDRRDEFGVPGTAEHLAGFIAAVGFDRAQALAPHEPTGAPAKAVRRPDDRSNIRWLLDQPAIGVGDDATLLPTAAIAIYQLPGANALDLADQVSAKMEELKERFPEGLEYRIPYDTTRFVEASIDEVYTTLYMALFLVIIVIYAFLQDWRATVIP